MPKGNPLASALGEDPFIPLKTHKLERASQKQKPIYTIKTLYNQKERPPPPHPWGVPRRPPSWQPHPRGETEGALSSPQLADPLNHHESGTGGAHVIPISDRAIEPTRPLGGDLGT